MKRARLAFSAPLIGLALLCAGCGSPAPIPVGNGTSTRVPAVPAAPTQADFHAEVQQAMQRFKATKSFRTKVNISTSQGEMNATLEFAKPNRFRGTIQLSDTVMTELIVVDNSLYMRVNGEQWLNLSKSPSAKTIGETLRNALQGDATLDALGTDAKVVIQKAHDASRDCDDYKTSSKAADGTPVDVDLCIANGLPKFLDMHPKAGPIHLEYYDYNAVFSVERPM